AEELRREHIVVPDVAVIGKQAWIRALAEVVEEGVAFVEVLFGRRVLRIVGEGPHGLVDGLFPRPERLILDVPDHPAPEHAPYFRAALDGGYAAHYRLGLDIFQDRLAIGLAERVGRQADRWLVIGVAWPLLPRGPWHCAVRRDPQRQAVVGDVVVQIDQARVDQPVRLYLRCLLKTAGRRVGALLDGLNDS